MSFFDAILAIEGDVGLYKRNAQVLLLSLKVRGVPKIFLFLFLFLFLLLQ